jgi:hypothetical protein
LFEMRTLTDELTVLNQAMDNAKNLKEEFWWMDHGHYGNHFTAYYEN